MNLKVLLLPILIAIFILIAASVFIVSTQKPGAITSFEDCVANGFPVMESYPRRCNADGQTFTENINPDRVVPPDEPTNVVCTLDAKICPDGSSVGRTGPNCEFAPCP